MVVKCINEDCVNFGIEFEFDNDYVTYCGPCGAVINSKD